MKAFSISKYKSALALTEAPLPFVGPSDVLVKITAASVNQLDEMLRVGTFKATLPYPLPLILGNDFSGEITQIGDQVTGFEVGDLVYGKPNQSRIGTFAEFIAVDENEIALAPKSLNKVEVAALPLVALTALQALEGGDVKSGDKVLIHGGAGGVGSMAIQLAKARGAIVATTVGTSNVDFVKSLGADIVIDYKKQDFASQLSGYDFALDTQGGETLMKTLTVLRPGARAIGIAGPPDVAFAKASSLNPVFRVMFSLLSSKVNKMAKSFGVSYKFLWVQPSGKQLAEIAELVDSGKLKPLIGREYSFAETPIALADLASGKVSRGKAVIRVAVNAQK